MKKIRIVCFLLITLALLMLLSAASAATYATVHGGWLRLRAEPSRHAEIIASYPTGSVVTVLDQANGWCHVQTSDYRIGYMMKRYLRFNTDPPSPGRIWTTVNQAAKVISANGRGVRLRSAPEVNSSNVLGLYPVGRSVFVYKSSNDGWSYIKIDRKRGYMMSEFLTTGVIDSLQPTSPVVDNTPILNPAVPAVLTSVSLNITSPVVGDTLALSVTPSSATYTAIWYRDDNQLLSTSSFYTVRASDAGHVIYVRVNGVGQSSGVVLTVSTSIVSAGTYSYDPYGLTFVPEEEEDVTSWMR